MRRTWVAALAAVTAAGAAHAADLTPTDIVNRHIAAAKVGVDAIMADFADDAVVLQAGRAVQGKAAIRALFARMLAPRPAAPPAAGAPPSAPLAAMKVTRIWQEGNVGFDTWEMGPVHATEEFLVRDGKIEVQAVFMNGAPPRPNP